MKSRSLLLFGLCLCMAPAAVMCYARICSISSPRSVLADAACRSRPAVALAKATKDKKRKKASTPSGGGGFGAKKETVLGPKELLRKSMDLYEELLKGYKPTISDSDSEGSEEEEEPSDSLVRYAVAMRVDPESGSSLREFSDWVPVAIAGLKCGPDADPTALMPGAIGACCREILECGCQAFPKLQKVGRSDVRYAFESLDSFETHVYEGLVGRADRKAAAAETLNIDVGASPKEVKLAHRKLMMELHPDRFVGEADEAAKAEQAQERMLEVQNAYEELGGGQGSASGSWYGSIGGKARVDFSGELNKEELGALGKERVAQSMALEMGGWRCGIFPMDNDVVNEFLARTIARSSSSGVAADAAEQVAA